MTQPWPDCREILDFWFPNPHLTEKEQQAQMQRWFQVNPAFDQLLAERFMSVLQAAEQGHLSHWQLSPEGLLALIIVLDQFSRNLYRGSGQAFANDAQALALAQDMIQQKWDADLQPLQRVFVYLPFEHSEDTNMQATSVALFAALHQVVSVEQQPMFAGFLDYAYKHQAVIQQFGRFPHRNQRLGRESSQAELDFLTQPGSAFG